MERPHWRDRVEARMRQLKIGRPHIARALGLKVSAVHHYFNGRRFMSVAQIEMMARALKWTVGQVLGESEATPPLDAVQGVECEPAPTREEVAQVVNEPAPKPYDKTCDQIVIVLSKNIYALTLDTYAQATEKNRSLIRDYSWEMLKQKQIESENSP